MFALDRRWWHLLVKICAGSHVCTFSQIQTFQVCEEWSKQNYTRHFVDVVDEMSELGSNVNPFVTGLHLWTSAFFASSFVLVFMQYSTSQEPTLCLPTKSELQQSSRVSEKHCCESSVHGWRRPQSSFTGELRSRTTSQSCDCKAHRKMKCQLQK